MTHDLSRFIATYGFPPGLSLDYPLFVGMMLNSNDHLYRQAMATYHGQVWSARGAGLAGFRAMSLSEAEAGAKHFDHRLAVEDAAALRRFRSGVFSG